MEIYNGIVHGITDEGSGISVLRTFRLLRILKLVRFLPNLRRQLVVMLRTMDNVAVFFALLMLFIFIFRYVCGSVTNRTKKTLRRRWCVLAQPRGLSNKGVGGNELVGQELLSTASKLKYCVRHCDSIRLERPKIKSMGDATYVLQPVNGFFQR